jgi:hypothetical protein
MIIKIKNEIELPEFVVKGEDGHRHVLEPVVNAVAMIHHCAENV